jgi:hypothetical protein
MSGYIAPPPGSDESITTSRFAPVEKKVSTPEGLLRTANPGKFLGIWPEWNKHYDIEPEIENKLSPIKKNRDVVIFDFTRYAEINIDLPEGAVYVGEMHGWTKGKYKKDESQIIDACSYMLSRNGANIFYAYGFPDEVNVSDSKVIGGGAVAADRNSSAMVSGGFGRAEAFVSKRANARVKGFYVPHEYLVAEGYFSQSQN